MKENITLFFCLKHIKIFVWFENAIMNPLKQPRFEAEEKSGFTVITSASPLALTQCATAESR